MMATAHRKGDMVKITTSMEGGSQKGTRKGSVGKVMYPTIFRGKKAFQVRFKNEDLTMMNSEIRKVPKRRR